MDPCSSPYVVAVTIPSVLPEHRVRQLEKRLLHLYICQTAFLQRMGGTTRQNMGHFWLHLRSRIAIFPDLSLLTLAPRICILFYWGTGRVPLFPQTLNFDVRLGSHMSSSADEGEPVKARSFKGWACWGLSRGYFKGVVKGYIAFL